MPVHVLERIELPVRGGHQLDHTHARVRRVARRLVEGVPAQEVRLDLRCEFLDEARRPALREELSYALDADKVDHDESPLRPRCSEGHWGLKDHGRPKLNQNKDRNLTILTSLMNNTSR